jgi:AcrR family transcriptional regulator
MVSNSIDKKRGPGRPREFDPDQALDEAVELFWTFGLEGVDVQRIARAVGVTKPSLYRLFGDKSQLFLRAMKRYSETIGVKPYVAFAAEPDIRKALQALIETAVRTATAEGRPRGCLVACVAAAQAGQSEEIRLAIQRTLATVADIVAHRFEQEIKCGALPATTSAQARGRLVVDTLQGLLLRARAGASQKELLDDAQSFVELLLR